MLPSRPFSGLLTDLYELTMAAGYVQNCFDARATFELSCVICPAIATIWSPLVLNKLSTSLQTLPFLRKKNSISALCPCSIMSTPTSSTIWAFLVSQNPDSIVFFFVHPIRLVKGIRHECCQHGRHSKRDFLCDCQGEPSHPLRCSGEKVGSADKSASLRNGLVPYNFRRGAMEKG